MARERRRFRLRRCDVDIDAGQGSRLSAPACLASFVLVKGLEQEPRKVCLIPNQSIELLGAWQELKGLEELPLRIDLRLELS